jgi:hypothetical protein
VSVSIVGVIVGGVIAGLIANRQLRHRVMPDDEEGASPPKLVEPITIFAALVHRDRQRGNSRLALAQPQEPQIISAFVLILVFASVFTQAFFVPRVDNNARVSQSSSSRSCSSAHSGSYAASTGASTRGAWRADVTACETRTAAHPAPASGVPPRAPRR